MRRRPGCTTPGSCRMPRPSHGRIERAQAAGTSRPRARRLRCRRPDRPGHPRARRCAGSGLRVEPYVPDRTAEGHGLSLAAVARARAAGHGLIITADTGSTSLVEVEAAARGRHRRHRHRPSRPGPGAASRRGPREPAAAGQPLPRSRPVGRRRRLQGGTAAHGRQPGRRPGGAAAGGPGGHRVGRRRRAPDRRDRAIVRLGLRQLDEQPRPGLAALLASAGIERGRPLHGRHRLRAGATHQRHGAGRRPARGGGAAAGHGRGDGERASPSSSKSANRQRRDLTSTALGEARGGAGRATRRSRSSSSSGSGRSASSGSWPAASRRRRAPGPGHLERRDALARLGAQLRRRRPGRRVRRLRRPPGASRRPSRGGRLPRRGRSTSRSFGRASTASPEHQPPADARPSLRHRPRPERECHGPRTLAASWHRWRPPGRRLRSSVSRA